MNKLYIALCVLFITATAYSQLGGRDTYQFLNLISSPRQAALGGKVITNYDYDPDSAVYNPASINKQMSNQLSTNYVNFLSDVNYGTASYAYYVDRRTQVVHASATYINYGSFDGRDETGQFTGEFGGGEAAFSLGYARNIPRTDIHIGANAKFITSRLAEYTSIGGAIDIGAIYNYEEWDLNAAIVVRNIGTQFTPFVDTIESLPLEIDAGISQILANVPIRWHLTLENLQLLNIAFQNGGRETVDFDGNVIEEEIGVLDNVFRHAILGLELFPRGGFNLRFGYNFRRNAELRVLNQRSFSGLSAGFGLKINKIRFNYAFARYNSAATSSFFGLVIDLE